MELQNVHKIFYPNHQGEEKQQMLNLNRRLETYLSRVKLLEEENELLAKEIQTIKHNNRGVFMHRKGLEEELKQTRLEVEAAWRDRVLTELEVGKLTEDLQTLNLQRQREAQAKVMAKTKLEQSRKELEEEQRAQIWLREKVNQLEHEMRHLIQTHEEDVAHLEDALTQSRVTAPPKLARKGNQTPDLLKMGHEFYQQATRAWQEAAEAYQGQLARLEESLDQTRNRLTQVGQEKLQSQMRLQTLEKEIASAKDVRLHLEKTVAQQRDKHCQGMQQLQEHLEDLEVAKEELGQQIDHLLQENRSLMQLKMSLGLEVATYRALLDSESLRGDMALLNKPRNICLTDAVFSPRGVKHNYQSQLSASHKTTFPSSLCGTTGPMIGYKKLTTSNEILKFSSKPADATKSATLEGLYPKIIQDGAVENFRPLEVHEKVTYAEPFSAPNEQETPVKTFEDKNEDDWNTVNVEHPEERPIVESVVSYGIESGLSSEPYFTDEAGSHQFTTSNLSSYNVKVTAEPYSLSVGLEANLVFEGTVEKEELQQLQVPVNAWVETEHVSEVMEHVQEGMSDYETKVVLEPAFQSECEPVENILKQVKDYNTVENISNYGAVEVSQELSSSMIETNGLEFEDKLYPDGEEMDTWDSVMERKIVVKTDVSMENEGEKQHAEPEEDISGKEPEYEKQEASHDDYVASTLLLTQVDDRQHAGLGHEQAPPPDKEEEDDEEDSQNVSVSWRTELESDSYAQDNTLADTRPLIRYKSDETDANTQASHFDESESSEGEQERKMGEAGAGTWSESKSKTFGTMEDLCEEVEEGIMDDDYNQGYTHDEDRDVSHGTIVNEQAALENETKNADEMVKIVSEGHSDEETEEFTGPIGRTYIDYDEELETDRLVEQELENLSTDSYSAHFTHSEDILHHKDKCVEELNKQKEAEKAATCEPGMSVNHEHIASTTIINRASENQYFKDSLMLMMPPDTVAVEKVQHKNEKDIDKPEKREEEDELYVSILRHAGAAEDYSGCTNFIRRLDKEDTNNPEDPSSELLPTADQKNLQHVVSPTEVPDALSEERSNKSQEHYIEDAKEFPEAAETAEWEVLENPTQDFEIGEQSEQFHKYNMPESVDEGALTHGEEHVKISPDIVSGKNNILTVKDGGHDLFLSDVKNDICVSPLETGATYEPGDTCSEAAEQTNQGFGDRQVWGNLENHNVINGNSGVDVNSPEAQMYVEITKKLCRNVDEDLVHSEESEVEAESWSSGEEPE
ncbi:nestin [Leuresthes tenuis]|uniref:nestin n=1 Tax=Leuresthes tenuis TaxID=355514 RepID=UPI003B50FEC9